VLLGLIGRAGELRWCNRQWMEFTGASLRDLSDSGWLQYLNEDDRDRLLDALVGGASFEIDLRVLRHDQRWRWMAVLGAPRPDRTFVVSAVDVTSTREGQRALQLLAAVGDELNASLESDEILHGVAQLLVGELTDMCTIAIRNAEGRLHRVAVVHRDEAHEEELEDLLSGPVDLDDGSALAQSVRTGAFLYRPIVDAPGPDEPFPMPSEAGGLAAPRSLICAPLRARDDVFGAIALVSWSRRFTPDDVDLVHAIAQRCSIAVDNAALYQRSEEALARLSLVASLGEQLAQTFDRQEMVETLVRRVIPLFADAATLAIVDEEEQQLRRLAVAHVDPSVEADFRATIFSEPMQLTAREPPARAVRTRKPVLLESYPARRSRSRNRTGNEPTAALAATSVLAVPLFARDRVFAVLTFVFAGSGRQYSSADIPLALDIARRGALALERARAFDQERQIAETLQHSMLPDALPDVTGITLCARYLPGGAIDVGGDWYDVIPLPGARFGLAIGDVAGHGVRAAAVMGQLRHALRAFASDGNDPVTVLARLNRFVFEQGPLDMATLCYGVLDPMRGRIEIAVAGHVPPLLVQPGRAAVFVEARSAPPIGADVSSRYSSAVVDLEPGATLVFFTDGLVERRGETLDAGLERLIDATRYAPPLLDAACDRLLDRLVGDKHPDDDVALLGVRYVGTARRHLRMRRPARADELAPVRRVLAAWLETAGVEPEDIGSIAVAVSEAATNAIEHAYGPAEGWFEVEADVEEGPVVTVAVRDGGRWRPKARGGGGRGLTLIARLVDDFELRRQAGGTEIWMRRGPRGKNLNI
jgi:GAF domain-containing protein/anti-sigma regulatory factor (Ser/Thr protein kinase)